MPRLARTLPWALAALVQLAAGAARAAPLSPADVPEPLKPWIPWVLQGATDLACPYVHASSDQRRCAWPSRLELTLGDQRGEFVQEWQVYDRTWVPLPGDAERWPQEVKIGDEAAVVRAQGGLPGVELAPGSHRLGGAFLWDSLPEKLQVPAETGLLALKIRGDAVPFPQRDNGGVLWLQKRAAEGGEENLLDIVVHRRIADEIPLVVTTQVEIHASGKNREVLLGKALLPGFVPMAVRSELPARLEPDGRLRVQIRPGRWTIAIDARHPQPLQQLSLPQNDGPWAAEEIWAFAAAPALRRVELAGATAVDPQQTLLPDDWKRLPAYRVRPGEDLLLTQTHRGEVDRGPDQLGLERSWWLDFDGRGFSIRDHLTGEAHDTRRLEVRPPAQLGYAESQGSPQFITALAEGGQPGVELRSTTLDLRAELRAPAGGLQTALSAVDWDQDFASVRGVLHLPPGYRLLHAAGVDEIDDTWLQRWTLLDIFLVLVISIAIARLYGIAWGTLALFTLALVFPEWMAPRSVWVFVLVGEAIHRALPGGRVRGLVRAYRFAALLTLTCIALAFTIQQVRGGLYPALEVRHDRDDDLGFGVFGERAAPSSADIAQVEYAARRAPAPMAAEEEPATGRRAYDDDVDDAGKLGHVAKKEPPGAYAEKDLKAQDQLQTDEDGPWQGSSSSLGRERQAMRKQQKLREYDANTVVQTGSGLPAWQWRTVPLRWNGPVQRDQQLRLWLVPPPLNLALAFIRVLFLITLVLAVFGVFGRRRARASGAAAGALGLVLAGAALLAPGTARAELPPGEMLTELRARLTEAPTCLPTCATSPRMRLEAAAGGLRIVQEVHVAAPVAVPLPGSAEQWLPNSVVVDGSPTAGGIVRGDGGVLQIELQPGRHEVVLEGPLPARETVQLALPLKPHRVESKATGWTVDGIHEDGLADDNLQLTRVSAQDGKGKPETLEVGTLPPFVRLERSLQLGLSWELTTRVVRLTPKGAAVVLGVPLLAGEQVTTADLRVEGGEVLVNMGPDVDAIEWTSILPISDKIALAAAVGEPWTEVWQVEVGPVWHVEHADLPTVRRGEGGLREWRPWPGEGVVLTITRPQGVPGQTLTIDRATLHLEPGLRAVDARLTLDVRSSRGGHHELQIPEGALLQGVTIRGQKQTIGQDGRLVRLPVEPGLQTVELTWREPSELGDRYVGPLVDLGGPAVNVTTEVVFPASRWILLIGGPRLGPAVLFWSFVIMLLLASAVLSRLRWSPLRGHQWFLLGLGLSPIEVPMAMLVIGWFLALAWRRDHSEVPGWWFDLRQLGLVFWTLLAGSFLVEAIHQGLLGQPDMQIEGNGSYRNVLIWYTDRVEHVAGVGGLVPRPWVLSVSLWWYRGLMLAWALWLAWSLIRWLPWAWHSFSAGGLWRPVTPPPPPRGPASTSLPSHASRRTPTPSVSLPNAPQGPSSSGPIHAGTSSASEAIFSHSAQSLVDAVAPPRVIGPSDTLLAEVKAPETELTRSTFGVARVVPSALPLPETITLNRPRSIPPPPPANPARRGAHEPEEMVPDDDDDRV